MIINILLISNLIVVVFFLIYYLRTRSLNSSGDNVDVLRRELELTSKKIEELDQAKREFIDIVTHELNTPLATTSGYLSMIIELPEDEVKPSVIKLAKKSYDGMQRMSKIVEDLMASSETISEGGVQAVQLEEIIEKIIEDFSEIAKERSLDVYFVPPKEIPLPLVLANPLSIKIILTNLIDNALKFTKKGGVSIETELQKDDILIKVKDTGAGISLENQKRIFEKFYQCDSSRTRTAGGTGVGLFIVKNLVERMGSEIGIKSKEGQGSTLYFNLPQASQR